MTCFCLWSILRLLSDISTHQPTPDSLLLDCLMANGSKTFQDVEFLHDSDLLKQGQCLPWARAQQEHMERRLDYRTYSLLTVVYLYSPLLTIIRPELPLTFLTYQCAINLNRSCQTETLNYSKVVVVSTLRCIMRWKLVFSADLSGHPLALLASIIFSCARTL